MRKCILLLLGVLAFGIGSAASDKVEIFVSADGSDKASGSMAKPVATLKRAFEIAAADCGKRPVTIYLREGNHRLEAPLEIGPRYSGTEVCPVTVTSYPGEMAEISSCAVIECNWTDSGNGIMVTEVPDAAGLLFDRLFVNGISEPMARYPDRNPEVAIFEGYAPDAIAPERVARWKNPAGGYVHAMHSSEWGGYQYTIEGKNPDGTLKLGAGFQNNRMAGMHPEYRMVENIFEELDAPGEWYFDRKASRLYYMPREGEDMSLAVVETPQAESLIILRGEKNNPVRYVAITNLELDGTVRTFLKTSEPLLRSDWKIYRGGAVMFENTENCSLTDCHIRDIGGNAVFFSGYNRHDSVRRNHIERIGASAVCFVGRPESVRSPLFEYNERQPWSSIDKTPGSCGDDYPAFCDVTDNLIHSIGGVEKQGSGIQISMSSDITVCHNSIYRLPRAGINISEGTWGGHVIEWNDVFETVRETGDHGSFNSWGRDRFWHPDRSAMDSLMAAHPDAWRLDAVRPTVIRNNRWRCDHGWDIDLDDGSSNYHIYNNLCLNGGLKLREGFGRRVENNVIVNNSFHPHVWFRGSGDEFTHNIVTQPYQPIGITNWGEKVDSNFFASEAGLEAARSNGTDSHSVAGDPMFVSPATGDYRVKPCSKALAVGFVNFPMDSFGVMHEPLRSIAAGPQLPEYHQPGQSAGVDDGQPFLWNGVRFKSITTEGERSATGIASVSGVLVTANSNHYIDLRPNDVILEFDNAVVKNTADLRKLIDEASSDRVPVVRFRNQKAETITVDCPKN